MNATAALVDEQNPFYCPTITATAYLRSLRGSLKPRRLSSVNICDEVPSFEHILESSLLNALHDSDSDDSSSNEHSYQSSTNGATTGKWTYRLSPLNGISSAKHKNSAREPTGTRLLRRAAEKTKTLDCIFMSRPPGIGIKRKRSSSSFSDLKGPTTYARSFDSANDSSFDVVLRRERLRCSIQDLSRASDIITATMRPSRTYRRLSKDDDIVALVSRVDSVMPGIRLKERLMGLKHLSLQSVTAFLADEGYINEKVLGLLQNTRVERICLRNSLSDENGLNICGPKFFPVFSRPGCFLSLSVLSFDGAHIEDGQLRHIQHLPKLSSLSLNNTGIGNEAVFLLVSLKPSLTRLSLAINPDINNDAVPALILLSRLSFVSILDTSIDMAGLRRIAESMMGVGHPIIDIEIPSDCERYMQIRHNPSTLVYFFGQDLQQQYILKPMTPLISSPSDCSRMSTAELRRNLAAHAAHNIAIIPSGTKEEMAERLQALLMRRKGDLLVLKLVYRLGVNH